MLDELLIISGKVIAAVRYEFVWRASAGPGSSELAGIRLRRREFADKVWLRDFLRFHAAASRVSPGWPSFFSRLLRYGATPCRARKFPPRFAMEALTVRRESCANGLHARTREFVLRDCDNDTYRPLLVMTISVPSLWNFSQSSLPSRVTLGSSTTPSSSGW